MKLILSSAILLLVFLLVVETNVLLVTALFPEEAEKLKQSLVYFEDFLNASINETNTQLASTSTSCVVTNVACNPDARVPPINFSDYIPREYAYVQPKEWIGQHFYQKMTQTCQLVRMGPQWLANYNQSNKTLLYQYFSYPDNYVGFYPASPWNCTQDVTYTPTERPYYVSGATGQKDMIILIDVSSRANNSAWRLATAKKIAIQIIRSLSYRDFVSVIPYGDQPDYQLSLNIQATVANVQQLVDFVSNDVQLKPNNGTNVGEALNFAFRVFQNSMSVGMTSRCTQVIVLLSSGDNDMPVPTPGEQITAHPETILFPFLVNNEITATRSEFMRILACGSNSIYRNITSDSVEEISKWSAVVDYFSKLLAVSFKRWSEVYEENDGQGQILSLSAPIFVTDPTNADLMSLAGVVSLDASVKAFNQGGNLTAADLNDFNLADQVCTPLQHRAPETADIVLALQAGMCSAGFTNQELGENGFARYATGQELGINKGMPGIVVGSVVFILILFGVGCARSVKHYSSERRSVLVALSVFLICWIIAIPILFTLVAPDLVRKNNYIPTPISLTAIKITPYRCCEISSCTSCTSTTADSCSNEISRLTRLSSSGAGPFPCGSGYSCCASSCSSCNCRRRCSGTGKKRRCSTSCSSCCRCTQSIRNRRCDISCGTCYNLVVKFVYWHNNELLQSQSSQTCSLVGAEQCRDAFVAANPVPSTRLAYVNPENPMQVVQSVDIRQAPFIAFMVFACFSIPFLLYAYYQLWKNSQRGGSVSAADGTWSSSSQFKDPSMLVNPFQQEQHQVEQAQSSTMMMTMMIQKPAPPFGALDQSGKATARPTKSPQPSPKLGKGVRPKPSSSIDNNNNNYNDQFPTASTYVPANSSDNVPPPVGGYPLFVFDNVGPVPSTSLPPPPGSSIHDSSPVYGIGESYSNYPAATSYYPPTSGTGDL